ncbi:MAG: hypothetical protein NVS4B11_27710 [Ktedonobacteraceae bacterium]
MITLTRSQALTTLIWVRFLIGAISWFLPGAMARLMQINVKANPALPYGLRLFGVRDVLMGMLIQAPRGDALDQQLSIGVAIDLIDVTASGIAGLTGQVSKRAAIVCCSAGLIGASLGAASLGKGPLSKRVHE